MNSQNNRKEVLRRRIGQVIKSRETGLSDLSGKTVEEILQEISIYHQELEFQNLELMRIQDELERSKKHYEELFSNAPIGYVIVDPNSIIHSANEMFAEMVKQKPEKLKSQNLNLFVHPDYQDRFYLLIKKVIKEKTKSNQLIKVLGAKKEYFIKMGCNVLNANGKEFIRIGLLDVTREVNNEQQLIESRERYRAVADFAYHWEYWQDPQGRLLYMSPSCERITGYNKNDFFRDPRLLEDIVHSEDKDFFLEHNKFAIVPGEKEEEHFADMRIIRKDGEIRWIGHVCQNIFNEDGMHLGLRVTNQDITARKLLENKLKSNEIELQEKNEEYQALNEELLLANDELRQTSDKLFQSESDLKKQVEEYTVQNEELNQINEELRSLTGELADSNERNSALVRAIPDSMFIFDRNGVILDYHSRNPQILLVKPEEFLNKNAVEVLPEFLADINQRAITKLFETGETQTYSYAIELNGKKEHFDARMVKYGNNSALAIVRVVTEQKIAEEKLRQSQETYLGIINSVSESIYVQDENGVFLEVNDSAIESHGIKREDIIGKTPEILSAGEINDLASVAEMVKKAYNGKPQRFEFWGRKADGTVFPDEVTLTQGVYFGRGVVIALARNISERKQAEEDLKRSEQRFQLSMEATNDGLWDWDIKTDMAYFSPAFFTMLGYKVGEFAETVRSWRNLLHPGDKETALMKISECIDGITGSFEMEFRLKAKNGDWLWVLSRGKCVERDNEGKAVRIVGTHVNINDRKNADNEILKRELLLNKIFDVLPIGLWFADENGKLIRGNPAGIRIWGGEPKVGPDEYTLFKARRLPSGKEIAPDDWALAHTISKGKTITGELIEIDALDGQKRVVLNYTAPVLDNQGDMLGAIVVNNDITELHKAQESLRANEQMLQSISDNMFDLVSLTDLEGNYTFAGASHKILGFEINQLIGTNVMEYVHPDDLPMVKDEFQNFIAKRDDSKRVVYRNLCADGSFLWFETVGRLIIDEQGNPREILFNSRDFTERRLIEDSLRESESRFRLFAELAPVGIIIADKYEEAIYLSPGFQKMLGYTAGDISNVSQWLSLACPDESLRGRVKMEWAESLGAADKTRTNFSPLEYPVCCKDGKIKQIEFRIASNNDLNFIVLNDITERKKAEEDLRESEERFRGLYENATVGIYRTTIDGKIILANPTLVKMLGYDSFDDLKNLNMPPEGYDPDDSRDGFKIEIAKNGEVHEFESTWKVKDGSVIYVSESSRIVCDKEGKPVFYEGIVEDITKRKKTDEAIRQNEMILKMKNEEYMTLNSKLIESNNRIVQINKELIVAREKAEESDKLKTAFLANMSHEIRTPMNAIIGFSEILLKPGLPNEKQDKFTRIINASCHQLLSMVNDMIDIAKIETGQLDVHISKANINDAITRVQDIFIPQAAQQNVAINISFQLIDEYAEIETDLVKLNQILTNLLSNAIKFTEEGEIEIGYTIMDNFIKVFVKDSGIGIKPEHHEIIFERFRQVELDYTRKYGGTGLGLPICKAFVEKLGGRIWVESEFGKGSNFYFTLPYSYMATKRQGVKNDKLIDYNLSEIVILVAEDEEVNFIFLNELLTEMGATVIHAADGIQAVKIFRENSNIDIVLMDIKMPGMDGIEATKAIKEMNNKIPVIAITAYALTGDMEKCLAAGCDDYVSKPIERNALLGLIQKLIER